MNKIIKDNTNKIVIGLVAIIILMAFCHDRLKFISIGAVVVFTAIMILVEYNSYQNKLQREQEMEELILRLNTDIANKVERAKSSISSVEDITDVFEGTSISLEINAPDFRHPYKEGGMIVIPDTASIDDVKAYLENEARPLLEHNIQLIEERYDNIQADQIAELKKQAEEMMRKINMSNLSLANKDKELELLKNQRYEAECKIRELINIQKKAERAKVKEQSSQDIDDIIEGLKLDNSRLITENTLIKIDINEAKKKAKRAERRADAAEQEAIDAITESETKSKAIEDYKKTIADLQGKENYKSRKRKEEITKRLDIWKSTASALGSRKIKIEKSYIDDLVNIENDKFVDKYVDIMTELYKAQDPRAANSNLGRINAKEYSKYEHAKVDLHYRLWYRFDSKTNTITFSRAIHHNKQNQLLGK